MATSGIWEIVRVRLPEYCSVLQPRQESNLYQKFRKLLFYPLNYGAGNSPSPDDGERKITIFRGI